MDIIINQKSIKKSTGFSIINWDIVKSLNQIDNDIIFKVSKFFEWTECISTKDSLNATTMIPKPKKRDSSKLKDKRTIRVPNFKLNIIESSITDLIKKQLTDSWISTQFGGRKKISTYIYFNIN